jgi:uncharacterized protein YdaT
MEKIIDLANKLLEECKKEKVTVLIAYGKDKTFLSEWGTSSETTPDRIKRARAAFMNAPSQTAGRMEFD